ncbi:MAG: hypothetical protein QF464_16460 [Myxococcota bacterium]|nr:hypothetical protein [Myxococcota bacterium]
MERLCFPEARLRRLTSTLKTITSSQVAVGLALVFVASCAPRLYYETTAFQHESVGASQRPGLVASLEDSLGSRAVYTEEVPGEPREASLEALDLASLWAAWALVDDDFFGAEADILIGVTGEGRIPVTVRVASGGGMTLQRGRAWDPRSGLPSTPEAALDALGIRAQGDARSMWTKRELATLALAIQALSPQERALLEGVPFIRTSRPTSSQNKGALYIQEGCKAWIQVFNRTFEADTYQFVGTPQRPMPGAVRTLLHEMGHAISEHLAVKASCALERAVSDTNRLVARYNATIETLNASGGTNQQLVHQAQALQGELKRSSDRITQLEQRALDLSGDGPVVAAYEQALGDSDAPTHYGEESPAESFAEAFALFRADPAALERGAPGAWRWFEAGGHLNAAR